MTDHGRLRLVGGGMLVDRFRSLRDCRTRLTERPIRGAMLTFEALAELEVTEGLPYLPVTPCQAAISIAPDGPYHLS
uniref:Uncharacterized protein n=1 Tax=Ralstonia solanacearum TaxID=305 RepID=A0A0S4UWE2_RALSL|nr:protein of unknown function [Ralstonia solanacearum]CUV37686.1 protein of unknown function [Ralstonia solanacearum]CUV60664.1 protein of unknown function [Ralstonia solanacearum]